MLNGGVSVDFINTKAAIRGSAWHRQTEQLRTLHPNNCRRLYRYLAWDWFFWGVYLYFFFALDYLLCRMSWSVVCSSCHAVRGNHYISFEDIFSCGQVFRVQSWGKKKILLNLFLSSKRLFLPTHKHVDKKQDTGGLKTITEESAPLLLKQLDTLCQAEPAKAEIPGSSDSSSNHPTASGSHILLSRPRFPPSFPKIKQGHAFISQSLAS